MKYIIAGLILFLSAAAIWYYHGQAKYWRHEAKTRATLINQIRQQQQQVAELDAKYTRELNNAKNEIDNLRLAVNTGAKRLRVRAACLPAPATAASVDNVGAAELNPDARADYFRLREQIKTIESQLRAAQQYINQHCIAATDKR